jgi:hypothetical protein
MYLLTYKHIYIYIHLYIYIHIYIHIYICIYISGVQGVCGAFFSKGYLDNDELLEEGFPVEYATPRMRLRYHSQQKEKDFMHTQTGAYIDHLRVLVHFFWLGLYV